MSMPDPAYTRTAVIQRPRRRWFATMLVAGLLTAAVMTLTPGAASADTGKASTNAACAQASYVSVIKAFGPNGSNLDLSNWISSAWPGRQILLHAGVFDGRYVAHTGVVAPNTTATFDYVHPTQGLVGRHTTRNSRSNCVIHHQAEVVSANFPPFFGPLNVFATFTPDGGAPTTVFLGFVTIVP